MLALRLCIPKLAALRRVPIAKTLLLGSGGASLRLLIAEPVLSTPLSSVRQTTVASKHRGFFGSLGFAIRVVVRAAVLFVVFVPILLLRIFPLRRWTRATNSAYLRLLYFAVLKSGPTAIKLGQWLATRPDLLSPEARALFSRLHTAATEHRWAASERELRRALGDDFETWLRVEEGLIGSGCIAQIHPGTLRGPKAAAKCGALLEPALAKRLVEGEELRVAVKVRHSGLLPWMEADVWLLRRAAGLLSFFVPGLSSASPGEAVDEFAALLEAQVDLRSEAASLSRFRRHFAEDASVGFPAPAFAAPGLLIETREDGIALSHLLRSWEADPTKDGPAKRRVAELGATALLRMIFRHNFLHADLHPGNILVRLPEGEYDANLDIKSQATDYLHKVSSVYDSFSQNLRNVTRPLRMILGGISDPVLIDENLITSDEPARPVRTGLSLCFLDPGMTVELGPKDKANFRALFGAVLRGDGPLVGALLVAGSRDEGAACRDRPAFVARVDALVAEARGDGGLRAIGKLDTSGLLLRLLETAGEFGVGLDPVFTGVVVSVLLMEGYGRRLDPELDLLELAKPFLVDAI